MIFCSLPVDFSTAEALGNTVGVDVERDLDLRLAAGMGGMPSKLNLPSRLLSFVMERSPSKTWMSTPGWLSAYVEKVWDFFAGTVVLRLMRAVMTPPAVSRPSDKGSDVQEGTESFSVSSHFQKEWRPGPSAPYATASSGLMDLQGSLPLKKSASNDWILGMRVDPPTRTTSLTWDLESFASLMTFSTGSMHLLEVVHVEVLEARA